MGRRVDLVLLSSKLLSQQYDSGKFTVATVKTVATVMITLKLKLSEIIFLLKLDSILIFATFCYWYLPSVDNKIETKIPKFQCFSIFGVVS